MGVERRLIITTENSTPTRHVVSAYARERRLRAGGADVPAERKMDPQQWYVKLRGIDVERKERMPTRTHLTTTYIQGF